MGLSGLLTDFDGDSSNILEVVIVRFSTEQ